MTPAMCCSLPNEVTLSVDDGIECHFGVRCICLACIAACFCCMQVVQTDEAIFDAVQAKFSTLTASLLPKLVCPVAPAVCLAMAC